MSKEQQEGGMSRREFLRKSATLTATGLLTLVGSELILGRSGENRSLAEGLESSKDSQFNQLFVAWEEFERKFHNKRDSDKDIWVSEGLKGDCEDMVFNFLFNSQEGLFVKQPELIKNLTPVVGIVSFKDDSSHVFGILLNPKPKKEKMARQAFFFDNGYLFKKPVVFSFKKTNELANPVLKANKRWIDNILFSGNFRNQIVRKILIRPLPWDCTAWNKELELLRLEWHQGGAFKQIYSWKSEEIMEKMAFS